MQIAYRNRIWCILALNSDIWCNNFNDFPENQLILHFRCFAERQVDLRVGGGGVGTWKCTRYIICGWVGMTIWYITLYGVGVVKKWSSLRYIICAQPPKLGQLNQIPNRFGDIGC